jgi:SPP1 gp7 family putative phage head morphogenesis protein
MFVRLVECAAHTHLLSARGFDLRALADGDAPDDGDDPERPAFLRMSFDEAVAFWRRKGGSPEILDQVLRAYRIKSAMAGDAMLDGISQRAVDSIGRILEQGGTLSDFERAVREDDTELVNLGITPASSSYLDLVFRTSVGVAYGAGRYKQLQDPDVIAARPFRQWRTSLDSRVRPEHAAGEGMVWRADDPSFANVMAPGGYRCRCAVVSLDAADLESEGETVLSAPRSGFELTPGFGVAAFAS